MTEFKIEDPPKGRGSAGTKTAEALAFLRANPGVWVRIAEYSNPGSATTFRRYLLSKDPSLEARTSRVGDSYLVYGRAA